MPVLRIDKQKNDAQKTSWFEVLPAELLTTADRTSGVFDNPYGQGLMLTVVVANEAGTFSATPKLQTADAYGGTITWWTASTAITANGTYQYLVYPVTLVNSAFTELATFIVPREWALFLDYTGTPATDKADTKASAAYI